jgi:hypothetical protein
MIASRDLSAIYPLEALKHAAAEAELRSARRTKFVVAFIAAGAILVTSIYLMEVAYQTRQAEQLKTEAELSNQLAQTARQLALELAERAKEVTGIRATSPDRTKFVSNAGYLVDATSNKPIAELGDGEITAVQFSPDGTRLVVGSIGRISIYGTSGKLLAQSSVQAKPINLLFSPDATRIIGVLESGVVVQLNSEGQEISTFQASEPIRTAAFSPDGKMVLTQSATGRLLVWDLQTGGVLTRITGPSAAPNLVGFSNDSRQIVAGFPSGELLIWDVRTGAAVSRFQVFAP